MHTTDTDGRPSRYGRQILAALSGLSHVYGGLGYEEGKAHRAKRRAKRQAARASRRANRR